VLSVLFATWIVAFLDRMAISVSMPYISKDFRLSHLQGGLLLSAFFATYALSHIPGGLLADRFGVRRVATIAMIWWSLFTAATGAATSLGLMVAARMIFGLGEGVFPACGYKTISTWFPKSERATANALMIASNPLGVALSPLLVVGIMSIWGWRAVFYCLFVPGLLMALMFWLFVPDDPAKSRRVSAEELAEINADEAGSGEELVIKPSFRQIAAQPNIIRYFLISFCAGIPLWGFTAWLPTYLVEVRGFSMIQMGVAASLPFFAGTAGCILGGWTSDRYFSADRRVPVIATEVLTALLLYLVLTAKSVPALLICQTLAGFSLTFFLTAFWALPMNTVPRQLMGVTSGFINMAGQLAAFVTPILIGYLIEATGGSFDRVFVLLIAAALASSAIALTLPRERAFDRAEPRHVL
jgi:sugar phosphate permease